MKNICQVYFSKRSFLIHPNKEVLMSENLYEVVSPLMGTFYRSSAPGEPALVDVGSKVDADQIVCVIESMKIFTELRSESAGVVKEIKADNEDMVMKGQGLIIIEKA